MTITLCDRCGRRVKGTPKILEQTIYNPIDRLNCQTWNKTLVICNNCVNDFNNWLKSGPDYKPQFVMENKE